ncbi:MAG TPA: hypothetical protein VF258_02690, partial [Luteolibacter sp.]
QASLISNLSQELVGKADDTFTITTSLNAVGDTLYEFAGEHADSHASSGIAGTSDRIDTHYWHSFTTVADFVLNANSPQVGLSPTAQAPILKFGEVWSGLPDGGGGQPIMIFTCKRKTVDETLLPGKNWAFSMPAHPFHASNRAFVPALNPTPADRLTANYENPFTYRMKSVNSWAEVGIEIQQGLKSDDQAFMGTSDMAGGQLRALAQEIPVLPPVSLAQLQHLPLFDYKPEAAPSDLPTGPVNFHDFRAEAVFMRGRAVQFPQNHAIGNSYASPGIEANRISENAWPFRFGEFSNSIAKRLDRSYVANKLLWDAWWCSSMMPQNGPFFGRYGTPRTLRAVADQFVSGARTLPNEACQLRTRQTSEQVLAKLFDGTSINVKKDADGQPAQFIRINGGYNVNSTSEKAWEQLFAQMLSRPVVTMNSPTSPPSVLAESKSFLVSRYTLGVGGPSERETGQSREDRWWDGSRELSAADLKSLARATVREVKKRGPFLSMADFVNRSLVTDTSLALKGALQAALDEPFTGINTPLSTNPLSAPSGVPTYKFPEAAQGALRQGISGWITQADLLQTIGPALSPRSDTFTIRAMGESRDSSGKVQATAWCEAVIQRSVEYCDSAELPDIAAVDLQQMVNKTFGRRMQILSFRWLPAREIN